MKAYIYKNDKITVVLLFVVVFIVVYVFGYFNLLEISKDTFNTLITSLSIVFGFYISSLAILFNSNFVKNLRVEDELIKKSQLKIHTFIAYFQSSFIWVSISLFICLFFSFLHESVYSVLINFSIIKALIVSTLSINLFFAKKIIRFIINAFLNAK
ncbi:hypothetical protein [Francisella philomiragia]|uniref:hypothetical protein n=1 Tax=Francisella philomiragia TaxID=28110 RepID=UPI0022432BE4|nr:hypothetical protein [Francisella philomiragia]